MSHNQPDLMVYDYDAYRPMTQSVGAWLFNEAHPDLKCATVLSIMDPKLDRWLGHPDILCVVRRAEALATAPESDAIAGCLATGGTVAFVSSSRGVINAAVAILAELAKHVEPRLLLDRCSFRVDGVTR